MNKLNHSMVLLIYSIFNMYKLCIHVGVHVCVQTKMHCFVPMVHKGDNSCMYIRVLIYLILLPISPFHASGISISL